MNCFPAVDHLTLLRIYWRRVNAVVNLMCFFLWSHFHMFLGWLISVLCHSPPAVRQLGALFAPQQSTGVLKSSHCESSRFSQPFRDWNCPLVGLQESWGHVCASFFQWDQDAPLDLPALHLNPPETPWETTEAVYLREDAVVWVSSQQQIMWSRWWFYYQCHAEREAHSCECASVLHLSACPDAGQQTQTLQPWQHRPRRKSHQRQRLEVAGLHAVHTHHWRLQELPPLHPELLCWWS